MTTKIFRSERPSSDTADMKTHKCKPKRQRRLSEAHGSAMCEHWNGPNMAYIDWHQDAIARRKRGEKQIFCHECGKYVWGEYWPNASGQTREE
jgi:hypothetical protein